MRRMTSGAVLLAAAMMLAPHSADAQRGPRGPRGITAGPRGQGVEMIMRLRERLELDEQQVRQLDEIRAEVVQRRTAHQAEMEELRSRVRAGQMEATELRELARQRQEAAESIREADAARVEAILTEEQKAELATLRGQARAFRQGRQSARRGRGPGGGAAWGGGAARGRALRPGLRGRGVDGPMMRRRWAPEGRPGFRFREPVDPGAAS